MSTDCEEALRAELELYKAAFNAMVLVREWSDGYLEPAYCTANKIPMEMPRTVVAKVKKVLRFRLKGGV